MLDAGRTVLLVIDIQDKLFPPAGSAADELIAAAQRLVRCAKCLRIPILVTEQNPEKLGGTNARVSEVLGDAPRYSKMEFGCLANAAFRKALEDLERGQLLLVGMETHVCVMQTALVALDSGYEVFVVRDAVLSAYEKQYHAGLERMDRAGAALVTAQMAMFELLRKAGTPEFKQLLSVLK